MALLEARGLVKQYGRRTVVNGVDLDVNAGEIVGLLGPNGAGKTTTFRMAVGMIAPKSGQVIFNGHDVTRMPMYQRARLGLGYLAQDHSYFRKLTVEQNIYAILELMTHRRGEPYHSTGASRRKRVDELLEQFSLKHIRGNIAHDCSGGEKRRLEIARCLASEPMLIMLDEPFTGIDPKTVGDIQEIIRDLRETGIAILITDHHVAETLRITDRSYLVAAGKMLAHGSPREIVNDPNARKVYLGEHFNASGIGDEQPRRPTSNIRSMLDTQETFDLVEQLGGDQEHAAANKLRSKGKQAVAPLLQGMQRKDRIIRVRSHKLLCDLLVADFAFDPDADEPQRLAQIAAIQDEIRKRLGAEAA